MKEASKTKALFGALENKIFRGEGIDIGCGDDPLFDNVRTFDIDDGDANNITRYIKQEFDFVFSSHCLEHMKNPFKAIKEWFSLVKTGGYLYVVVPDEDLYEQGSFPSRFNQDHKFTFTIYKEHSWSPVSINIFTLINSLQNVKIIKIELQDHMYDHSLHGPDQTLGKALAQIVFCLQKIDVPPHNPQQEQRHLHSDYINTLYLNTFSALANG